MFSRLSSKITTRTHSFFTISKKGSALSNIEPAPSLFKNGLSQSNILKKLNININDIEIPATSYNEKESVNYTTMNPISTANMYNQSNLGATDLFPDGYINFGYYQGINCERINRERRVESSKNLYELIEQRAEIKRGKSSLLELGGGLGQGGAYIMNTYEPAVMKCLDINEAQVARARKYNQSTINKYSASRFDYIQGSAENIPFSDNSFTIVISIEAAQHFEDLGAAISETYRILTPGGRAYFTIFFARNEDGVSAIKTMLPDSHVHCSHLTANQVESLFSKHFEDVEVESIGKLR